jgi:hypothetical protein
MAPPPPVVAASAASGNSVPVPRPATGDAPSKAITPDAVTFDYTHLGEKGSALFGRMVARELIQALPELRSCFKP